MSGARDALRRDLRAARERLGRAALERAGARVERALETLLDAFAPRTVAGYVAVGGELPVAGALRACRARGATTFLPVIDGDTLAFLPFDEATPLRANRYGIAEPDVDVALAVEPLALDLVLVPLVGFDESLERLGMGGGFYDRSFAARRDRAGPPWLVGVAHERQRVESVLPDWWDVPLDAVVTERRLRRRDSLPLGRAGPVIDDGP